MKYRRHGRQTGDWYPLKVHLDLNVAKSLMQAAYEDFREPESIVHEALMWWLTRRRHDLTKYLSASPSPPLPEEMAVPDPDKVVKLRPVDWSYKPRR
jgi:hypothetical protein